MASLKITLDTRREKADGNFPLVFRISSNGKSRDIPTGFSVQKSEWNFKTGTLKKSHTAFEVISKRLNELQVKYLAKIIELERVHTGIPDVQELKEHVITSPKKVVDVFSFWKQEVENMKKANRHGNARVSGMSLNILQKVKSLHIPFSKIDFEFLKEVETSLRSRGVNYNSIGVYMRALRAIYNQAINFKVADYGNYPFRAYKIKKEVTVPHPMSIEELKRYFRLNLDRESLLHRSLLLGKLIFLLAGINATDLFLLTEDNLRSGRVTFIRSKTKKLCSVQLLPEAKDILEQLKFESRKTLCSVLSDEELQDKSRLPLTIRQKAKVLNAHLLKIGTLIETAEPPTSYTFRYSIGAIGRELGYSLEQIGALLFHSTTGTARITSCYVLDYSQDVIDKMHAHICDMIQK